MSVKNKAKDRNEKGKIRREYTTREKWVKYWRKPTEEWTNLYVTRPKRRATKHLCKKLMQDLEYDGVVFPSGNDKPREYYW